MVNITKKQISRNYSTGRVISPEYIVIHETDNPSRGANAMAHFNYWNTNDSAQASTHFVVDDSNIIQMLELNMRAWHVGDNSGYSNITNNNSIGIEICVNSDGDYNKAYYNTVDLVRYLMTVTGLGADRVKMHNHASGKHCPSRILDNNWWGDFMSYIYDTNKETPTSPNRPSQPINHDWCWIQTNYLPMNEYGTDVMGAMKAFEGIDRLYLKEDSQGKYFETQWLTIEQGNKYKERLGNLFYSFKYE